MRWLILVSKIVVGLVLLTGGIGASVVALGYDLIPLGQAGQIISNSFLGMLTAIAMLVSGLWILLRDRLKNTRLGIMGRSMRMPQIPATTRVPSVRSPRMAGIPTFSLGQGKVKWVILGSVMLSGLVVAVGIAFAIQDVVNATYEFPRAGAQYADLHAGGTLGQELPPYSSGDISQTLQITLAADARISELTFKDMDLGRVGLTDCIVIQRDASNTTGYLFVDDFYITGTTSAPSFDMANAEIASLQVAGSIDGHTNNSTLDSTVSDQTILSLRGTGSFSSDGGVVDRIILNLLGDAIVSTLTYENVKCSVGGFNLDYIKAGLFQQDATTKFGTGTGVDSADWVLNSTVKYRTSTDTIVDTPITVR